MALDKVLIGARIRKVREEIIGDSRAEFAKKCGLSDERYIGQLERGEFLPSLATLDKISNNTGIKIDYLLYGKNKTKLSIRESLVTIIKNADNDEVKMYYKCITTMKGFFNKKLNG